MTVPSSRTAGLDGIRAFAVLAVLAFHFGAPGMGGGSLGVDVFFVLSGYLITSLLVRERERTGAIGLGAFWTRRARRLFPALFVLLVAVVLYARFDAAQLDLSAIRGDELSTIFYVANWHFIFSGQGYFAHASAPSPLLHTWTLGVEEQYYLIWPVVALVVLRRYGRVALARTAAVGAVASAVLMVSMHAAGFSLDRLYYGSDTRVQALLVGSFLGAIGAASQWRALPERWSRSRGRRGAILLLGLAGAGFVGWAFHATNGQGSFLYEGGFFLVAVAVALVLLAVITVPESFFGKAFSLRPLRYVGRISYGVYLYHWPAALILDHAHTGLSGPELLLARLALTFTAATTSFELLEKPVREGRLFRSWRAPATAFLAAAVAVSGAVMVVSVGPAPAGASLARATRPATATPYRPALTRNHPVLSLMVGDSVALTLFMGLSYYSRNYGVEFVTAKGTGQGTQLACDLDPGETIEFEGQRVKASDNCRGWRGDWAKLVRRYDPDVVTVLLGRWEIMNRFYDGHWTHIGDADWNTHLTAELQDMVRVLSSEGASVVLLTMPYSDPPVEASDGSVFPENLPSRVDAYNNLLRRIAWSDPHEVSLIDLNTLLDPDGHYAQEVDGVDVRWPDGVHVSVEGGLLLQHSVLPRLVALGFSHDESRSGTRSDNR